MTLDSIAKSMLEQYGMDINEAKKHVDAALTDSELKAHFDEFVKTALIEAMADAWRAQRYAYRPALNTVSDSPRMRRVMDDAAKWMDFPISATAGLTLGESNRKELTEWCQIKRKRLSTEMLDISFIEAVASELKADTDQVKAHFVEADLRQIRRKVERQSAAA